MCKGALLAAVSSATIAVRASARAVPSSAPDYFFCDCAADGACATSRHGAGLEWINKRVQ